MLGSKHSNYKVNGHPCHHANPNIMGFFESLDSWPSPSMEKHHPSNFTMALHLTYDFTPWRLMENWCSHGCPFPVGWLIEGVVYPFDNRFLWWQMVYQTGPSIFIKRTLLGVPPKRFPRLLQLSTLLVQFFHHLKGTKVPIHTGTGHDPMIHSTCFSLTRPGKHTKNDVKDGKIRHFS